MRWLKMCMMLAVALCICSFASCAPKTAATLASSPVREVVLANLSPGCALLIEGTSPVEGLPGLSPNAFPALAGEYAYMPVLPASPGKNEADYADAKALRIRVWFTRQALLYPETWTPVSPSCLGMPAASSILSDAGGPDDSFLWAIKASGYTLFIRFPGAMSDPCSFASVFAERFAFFIRYAESPGGVSFPAVLELSR